MPAPVTPIDLKRHKARSDKAWAKRGHWQKLYDDAYEYAIPYRRPSAKDGPGAQRVDRLFDSTAIASTFRGAGQLQQDLFPPGQRFFNLKAGPVAKVGLSADQAAELDKELDRVATIVAATFGSEFDEATQDMCVDLFAGTGCMLTLEGVDGALFDDVCIPFDECAIEIDARGRVCALFWKTTLTRRQISVAFEQGKFPDDFTRKLKSEPDGELPFHQDYIREKDGWRFVAHFGDGKQPVVEDMLRVQPFAAPRYYRVPGEAYGRGPILLALPTIKTLNKAMELTLKAAAIEMMGIWGYRPGGAFNPDTARFAPGAMWAMTSTGGVMGPDVSRLNTAAGKIDVAQLINQDLRLQVQTTLHDDRIPDKGKTPVSASEIVARMKRIQQTYLGAFGRLVNAIIPVVVRRRIDILYRRGVLKTEVKIDDLLVKIEVLSPMASALKAGSLAVLTDFIELVLAVKGGPQLAELIIKLDDALTHIGKEMGVPPMFLLTADERVVLQKKIAAAAAQMAAAQAMQAQQTAQAAQPQQPQFA